MGQSLFAPLWLMMLAVALGGCSSTRWVTLRSAPQNPLGDQLQLTAYGGPRPSARTMQLLRVYNLAEAVDGQPRVLLERLQGIIDRDPSADKVYALAELAYLGAKKVQSANVGEARDLYAAAVLHAYNYLFDPRWTRGRSPYDPQFRSACDVYNSALEAALRIDSGSGQFLPGRTATIQTAAGPFDVSCVLRGGACRAEEFARFDFVSNYEICGLRNHYLTYGLGVPLIAVRRNTANDSPAARYYPTDLSFPVTAFLRPIAEPPVDAEVPVRRKAVLELYDPLSTGDLQISGMRVPLESDLTTPLAYFLSQFRMDDWATEGLFRPDLLLAARPGRPDPVMGLYMVQPYEPGKIPVLLIHGLWSSPMTWMEMFNDLLRSPEIREHYQFWCYLYPTSQPFWISAAQLRSDLAAARNVVDPQHREPALDQMVLVGHSMGGLVAKLQVLQGSDDLWRLVSREPFAQIRAEPESREKLETAFYFQPNPSVRRVITIATPHQGSSYSNQTTQWVLGKIVHLPAKIVESEQELFHDNPAAFGPESLLRIENSIDALAPGGAVFTFLATARRPPWVKFHNIVGQLPPGGVFSLPTAGGDGVVSATSAHAPDAESEVVVPAAHLTVHTHPLAVLEVRRILLEHLGELTR